MFGYTMSKKKPTLNSAENTKNNVSDDDLTLFTYATGVIFELRDREILKGGIYQLTEKGQEVYEKLKSDKYTPLPHELKNAIILLITEDTAIMMEKDESIKESEVTEGLKDIFNTVESAIDYLVVKNEYNITQDLPSALGDAMEYLLEID
jgi:hypothetical protein